MLAAKAQCSLANAERYFREHLSVGDYYTEGQHVPGHWFGQGAADLGLSGVTKEAEFIRLCENLDPQTGEQLTLRQKTTRTEMDTNGVEHQSANRRVFYDFTFSPPKSVSIAALAGDDSRIVEAHDRAMTEALDQLQTFAATRVRKNGQCADRTTGNIVAAVFRHDTSRALDPHLHSHCILFNATYDAVEQQWKALQNHDMLAAQKFVENVYYHELARELVRFGYQLENKPRGDFEIKGVAPELIEKFSKRHRQIDEKTKELLAREPEKAKGNVAAIRENIAHRERPPKVRDMALSRLQELWDKQMTAGERESLRNLAVSEPPIVQAPAGGAERAVGWAEEHLFERRSVVNEHDLWRHALEHARGENIRLADVQAVTRQRDYIRDEKHPGKVASREHLEREWQIVCLASDGRRCCDSLAFDCRARNDRLDDEQREAVNWLVSSRDLVSLFRGGAGTGKSFTLREVQRELRERNCLVHVVAPQRQQVIGLEQDGLENVETVSAFLARRQMPRHAVVLVDEAGQIGGKQMHALLRMAQEHQGRVILSGDTRQHGAVEATDALRAIEKYAGLPAVELTNIRRQNPALAKSKAERQWIEQYRQAVADARDGKLAQSFKRLDQLQAIEPCTLADQHGKLAARYVELAKQNQSCVVVSQSWNEIHTVNDTIRAALKNEKRIGCDETTVTAFLPVDLTGAQKREARAYAPDSVLVFNRDVRGFKAGESAKLKSTGNGQLIVENETRVAKIPFKQLDKVTVCQGKEMALSPGDRLQLKANGRSVENKKLANGELVTVKTVQADGRIALTDGRTLDQNFRQFVRGYAVTSYAAQGKSVDYVLFSDSAVKAATNNQQWYVTISRGKKGIHIFTGDKEQLRDNITRSGDRPLALDMAKPEAGFGRHLSKTQRRAAARLLAVEHSQRAAAKRRAEGVGQSPVFQPSTADLAQTRIHNQGMSL
jgi:conjugative relaxase-like TrwC/TraI family protein